MNIRMRERKRQMNEERCDGTKEGKSNNVKILYNNSVV
jgi:hypothetical protein